MIPLEEAQRIVLDGCALTAPVEIAVDDALHSVIAVDVHAREQVPAFDNSAMDGYAVQAADTAHSPALLRVVGEVAAGDAPNVTVGPGEAAEISTGAAIPPGADAVVNVEATERRGSDVLINAVFAFEKFVRRAGSDLQVDDRVITAGTELRPSHLGVLHSIGQQTVQVYPRLRVGVLSTGNELVVAGGPLAPGKIRESTKHLLRAALIECNTTPIDLGIARDDKDGLLDALRQGVTQCDAIVTTGGVSVGQHDLVKDVLGELGIVHAMQIAIQPAKPFAFGVIMHNGQSIPVFGLPGNPVSSLVSFELLARPALRKMMGHEKPQRNFVRAIATNGLKRFAGDGKVQWQRVDGSFGEDGRLYVRPTGEQGSHQLANSAAAIGLARVPDSNGIPLGGEVDVMMLDW